MRKEDPVCRFWRKVAKSDGCWLWTAHTDGWGYGALKVGRKVVKAHRFSWELHCGTIPRGMRICHTCDTPACVRPSHLFLGTDADNMRDRNIKRRHAHNERHPRAKLTTSAVREIRLARSGLNKVSIKELATRYGVHHGTISRAARGVFWDVSEGG